MIRNLEIGTGRPCETAPLLCSNVDRVYYVTVVDDFLEFSPPKWEDGDWKVLAKITPKVTISPTPYPPPPPPPPSKRMKPMEFSPCIVASLSDYAPRVQPWLFRVYWSIFQNAFIVADICS